MWIIKNLVAFVLWVIMSWLLFQQKELWLTICAALMCAAPLAKYATFHVDASEIPAHVGISRFTSLQAFTAMTIAKAANYGGKAVPQDPRKIMRVEDDL